MPSTTSAMVRGSKPSSCNGTPAQSSSDVFNKAFPTQRIRSELSRFLNQYGSNNGKHLAQVRNTLGHPCTNNYIVADFVEVGREAVIVNPLPDDPSVIKSLLNALTLGHRSTNSTFSQGLHKLIQTAEIAAFYKSNALTGTIEFNRSYKALSSNDSILLTKQPAKPIHKMLQLKDRLIAATHSQTGARKTLHDHSLLPRQASVESLSETDATLKQHDESRRQRIVKTLPYLHKCQNGALKAQDRIHQFKNIYEQLSKSFPELGLPCIEWKTYAPLTIDDDQLLSKSVPEIYRFLDELTHRALPISEQADELIHWFVIASERLEATKATGNLADIDDARLDQLARETFGQLKAFQKPKGLHAVLGYLFKGKGIQIKSSWIQRLTSLLAKNGFNHQEKIKQSSDRILECLNAFQMADTSSKTMLTLKKAMIMKEIELLKGNLNEHYKLGHFFLPIKVIEISALEKFIYDLDAYKS